MIEDYFMFSWKNMKHRQLRSWLTIIGVVIGIAAIVSLISLGQGFEDAVVEQFNVLGSNRIRVVPEGLTGPPVGVTGLTEDDVDTIRDVKGVDFAGGLVMNLGQAEYNNQETYLFIKGIDGELAEENKLDITVNLGEGDWFTPGESRVAVIGYGLSKDYFDKEIFLRKVLILE